MESRIVMKMKSETMDDAFENRLADAADIVAAEINALKLKGEQQALFEAIAKLTWEIRSGFENIMEGSRYNRLQNAVTTAREKLDKIEVYFVALKKLDPSHK